MLDIIWFAMVLTSLVFAVFNGTTSDVANAIFTGASSAVTLSISLLGTMGFWLGITEIIVDSGLSKKITKLLMPIIKRLFPRFKNNTNVCEKISLNFTANLLGIGNAATPLGLQALEQIEKLDNKKTVPSKEAILFVVINTASLQILPTQMAGLRASLGSTSPFGILVPVWIVSAIAMCTVVVLCEILGDLKWKK